MPKRFIDSAIWSDPWFQDLENMDKLIWIYLFTNCCIVGTWEFNPKRAEFDLGKKINWESVKKCFSEKILFTEKYWIIKNFIKQQYPNILKKPKAPLHIAVLSEIEKKCLKFDLNSLSIVYEYTIDSVQVKVKEKVKVEEEVKEEELFPEITSPEFKLIVPDHLKKIWPYVLEMRKKIRYPMTEYAQELAFKRLQKLSPDENVQVEIVEQTIECSYRGFFELKQKSDKKETYEEKLARWTAEGKI